MKRKLTQELVLIGNIYYFFKKKFNFFWIYRDDNGKPYVFQSVRNAEKQILDERLDKVKFFFNF